MAWISVVVKCCQPGGNSGRARADPDAEARNMRAIVEAERGILSGADGAAAGGAGEPGSGDGGSAGGCGGSDGGISRRPGGISGRRGGGCGGSGTSVGTFSGRSPRSGRKPGRFGGLNGRGLGRSADLSRSIRDEPGSPHRRLRRAGGAARGPALCFPGLFYKRSTFVKLKTPGAARGSASAHRPRRCRRAGRIETPRVVPPGPRPHAGFPHPPPRPPKMTRRERPEIG